MLLLDFFLGVVKDQTYVVKSYSCITQSRDLMTQREKTFENIMGKEENAGNQHFLLFPQCFLPSSKTNVRFYGTLSSANAFDFDKM